MPGIGVLTVADGLQFGDGDGTTRADHQRVSEQFDVSLP